VTHYAQDLFLRKWYLPTPSSQSHDRITLIHQIHTTIYQPYDCLAQQPRDLDYLALPCKMRSLKPCQQHQTVRSRSMSSILQRHSTGRRTARCATPTNAAPLVLFDLDAAVSRSGLEAIVSACAFHAARQHWGADTIPGNPSAYTATMARLVTCTEAQEEAALLVRLLADEGIIGARSTAGREGPVIGRPVRQGGSRPLLVAEVQEHWWVALLVWGGGCGGANTHQQFCWCSQHACQPLCPLH